jgi:hypothetical protein
MDQSCPVIHKSRRPQARLQTAKLFCKNCAQKYMHKKRLLILDTPEHVDSENIKLKIGSRSLLYQLFSKRDF